MIPNKMLLRVVAFVGIMILAPLVAAAPSSNTSKPRCQSRCGDLIIPYPFGVSSGGGGQQYGNGSGCYFDDGFDSFLISCNKTNPIPYLANTELIVSNISLENHEVQVMVPVSRDCYSLSGDGYYITFTSKLSGVFSISSSKNKFTAIGCDTVAMFKGSEDDSYSFGCTSLCKGISEVMDGSCSGIGCCQTSIPRNTRIYSISLGSYYNHSKVLDFNPCSFAFVSEIDYFNFSSSSLYNVTDERVPLVYDWVGRNNGSCMMAKKDNATTYLSCGNNTHCRDNSNGQGGYRCYCKEGYQGNPYLLNGCQDIDECTTLRPCNMKCKNVPGSFSCPCPKGFGGDGLKNGTGCHRIGRLQNHLRFFIASAIGGGSVIFLLLAFAKWTHNAIRRRQKRQLKEKFFERNGGFLLQRKLSSFETSGIEKGKLFNSKELEKATDNFNKNRILGQGGQGTVYKGMLSDGRIVAVKKSRVLNEENVSQFINEVSILSQISHRNVVALLGCCLETEVPLLVYEFIPNGTLYRHLHDPDEEFPLSWNVRLRIATEVAQALSYLHFAAAIPIYHRDVKTVNILLDEKYCAKVADFGTSRTLSVDESHVTTLVQGTFGYLDPEYFQSSQFTDKSDVYSFGVVLVELLTRQKPVSTLRAEEGRSLAMYLILSMNDNRLFDILDPQVRDQGRNEDIQAVAYLARRCLRLNGKARPTMKEVAAELEAIRTPQHQYSTNNVQVITEYEGQVHDRAGETETRGVSSALLNDADIVSVHDEYPLMWSGSHSEGQSHTY